MYVRACLWYCVVKKQIFSLRLTRITVAHTVYVHTTTQVDLVWENYDAQDSGGGGGGEFGKMGDFGRLFVTCHMFHHKASCNAGLYTEDGVCKNERIRSD